MSEVKHPQKLGPVAVCSHCRSIFLGKGLGVRKPCPECETPLTQFIFDPECLVGAIEDQTAFRAAIEFSDCETVKIIAGIMGFQGPHCHEIRKADMNIVALEKWKESQRGA